MPSARVSHNYGEVAAGVELVAIKTTGQGSTPLSTLSANRKRAFSKETSVIT